MFLEKFSLKNKIFISFLGFILLVSIVIALFTRWLLISSLTAELQKRGTGIAQGVADSARVHILTKNRAELTALVFNTKTGNKIDIVNYLIIGDEHGRILAHTFLTPFPKSLASMDLDKLLPSKDQDHVLSLKNMKRVNTPSRNNNMQLPMIKMHVNDHDVFHLVVPVKEGLYTIGFVHIGLAQQHIRKLIEKLRFLFLSFLSAVTIVFFIMSNWLAHAITRPISSLIRYTDRITSGDYNITFPEKPHVFTESRIAHDEINKLTKSFIKMTSRIRSSREEILESESKYRSLFNSGPNPIFVLEKQNLTIIDANPKAVEFFGYGEDELFGMSFLKLGSLSSDTFVREYPREQSSLISAKVRFYKKNGDSIFVNIHASQSRYRNINALTVATTDITELIEKDSQLIQASKITNLEKMSVGIAHELNQPLNAIKLGSEYLTMMNTQNKPIHREEMDMVSKEISEQVTRAAGIVGRLKKFSRKSDFSREIININNCIRSVCRIIDRQLLLQKIHLTIDLDDAISPVLAHHNRIEQVIFNLITNARDAILHKYQQSPELLKGQISISSFLQKEQVIIMVKDNGIGIEKSQLGRIFETFYTTKTMGEGMGLGLPIIHGIVKDFSGTMDVESQKGKGSCFTVSFPMHQTAISR